VPEPSPTVDLLQYTAPDEVGDGLRAELVACWIAVSNAGGAAGFPFPPVDASDVTPVAEDLIAGLDPRHRRLVVARYEGRLAGWVSLHRDPNPLVAHWGVVRHLQTDPRRRAHGIGSTLMERLRTVARDELGLSQLHLAVRGGLGLEDFYRRLGWRETGRWPNALRFPDGDRDEVLMVLQRL
jgi:GNAT superfamily N-acetyltransferase